MDSSDEAGHRRRLSSSPPSRLKERLAEQRDVHSPEGAADGAPFEDLARRHSRLAELAVGEARDYEDARRRKRETSKLTRMAWRACSAAGRALRAALLRAARLTLDLLRRLGRELARLGARAGQELARLGARAGQLTRRLAMFAQTKLKAALVYLWTRRRTLATASLLMGLGGFGLRAAQVHRHSLWNTLRATTRDTGDALYDFGAETLGVLDALGLVASAPPTVPLEPAAAPPRPARYVLEIITVPAGASASVAGRLLRTPATIELAQAPSDGLRIALRLRGHQLASSSVTARDFVLTGNVMRHTLRVTLRSSASAKAPPPSEPPAGTAIEPSVSAPPLPPGRVPLDPVVPGLRY